MEGKKYGEILRNCCPLTMCESYCPDCKRNTDVVFDHSAGDTVCTECGLVIEAHSIDETSEWRTFADDSGRNHNDPDRVGDRTNPLLPEGRSLTTFISNTNANGGGGGGGKNSLPRSRNNSVSNSDRSILEAFEAITSMSERLGLVSTIKDRAKEIYSKVELEKTVRGRNKDAIVAACLYIACRKEEKPRTVKEICSVANGVTKKQLGAAKEFVLKQMEADTDQLVEMGTIHAEDFVRRFGFHLGMSHQAIKAAQEVVQKSDALDIRRSPVSVAAAVVYIITQLSDDKKTLRDIFNATGVSEGTIRNTFKDLYPNLTDLIPAWFAKADKIKSLINS